MIKPKAKTETIRRRVTIAVLMQLYGCRKEKFKATVTRISHTDYIKSVYEIRVNPWLELI